VTFTLAILTMLMMVINGLRLGGKHYLAHFSPGPLWLAWLLIPVEIIGTLAKTAALAIRLFANMVAGHVLLTIFFLFTHDFIVHNFGPTTPFGILTLIVASVLILFELLVISLQAYIFTMLTASYISEAIHGHGDHDEHATEAEPVMETEGLAAASPSR
jgi:F-type H+-transporting ATPase subunit a